ncbi:MAG: PDZ domain-containing protein, partial [Chitinophagaceae bacterium]
SYTGYAFAVPANLARKILDDLKQFGSVQRGLLGVSYPAPSDEDHILKQQDIDPGSVQGVFITGIQPGSAAEIAGLKEGDIIQKIDDIKLYSSAEFSERIARRRPGDEIKLEFLRDGKLNNTIAVLKKEEESQSFDKASIEAIHEKLGARFENITDEMKDRYSLYGGVIVSEIKAGGFFDRLGIPPGTIIAFINGVAINNQRDIDETLMSAQNSLIQILGIAPDGSRIAFNFSLGA